MQNKYKTSIRISIVIIIITSLLWIFAFNLLHYPKNYESLYLFYAGDVSDYNFNTIVTDSIKDDSLKHVEVIAANPNEQAFDIKYNIVCFNKCDIAILPLTLVENTQCDTCFSEVEDTYDLDLFRQNDVAYGYILNEDTISFMSDYLIFNDNETYVLVILGSSVNNGELTNNNIKLLDWIIQDEDI